MLEAQKSELFQRIFAVYNRNLIRRRFNSWQISGLENLEKRNLQIPTVVFSNHSSWWDGLLAFQIARNLKIDGYAMMEEKNLLKYPFHRKLGAFSVVRESPKDGLKALNYAVKLLQEKSERLIWIFPQGEILANDVRPLKFFNGVSRIIEKLGKCQVFAVAFRFEIAGEFKPEIFTKVSVSEIIEVGENLTSKNLTQKLEKKLETTLDELKKQIISRDLGEYQNIR